MTQELWDQFNGLKNTDDVIIEKARACWHPLSLLAWHNTQDFLGGLEEELDKNKISKKYGEIFMEASVFYLHLMDRIAFESVGPKQRSIFMDELLPSVGHAVYEIINTAIYEEEGKTLDQRKFFAVYNFLYKKQQEEYGRYTIPEKGGDSLANNLFYEFGKHISKLLIGETDIIIGTSTLMFVSSFTEQINPFKLFGGPLNK